MGLISGHWRFLPESSRLADKVGFPFPSPIPSPDITGAMIQKHKVRKRFYRKQPWKPSHQRHVKQIWGLLIFKTFTQLPSQPSLRSDRLTVENPIHSLYFLGLQTWPRKRKMQRKLPPICTPSPSSPSV